MASTLPQNARMMHARVRLARKTHAMLLLPLFYTALLLQRLPKSWNMFLAHCRILSARGNAHRPSRISIGCLRGYRPFINGRSALNVAGRQNLPAENSFDSNRGQAVHGIEFQAHVSMATLPIM